MILELEKEIPSKIIKEEHYVAPCIKCGCDEIKIEEYEDRYGFISTATCKNCKSSLKENTGKKGIIKAWNNANDIQTLIANKSSMILSLKAEIKELKAKARVKSRCKTTVKTLTPQS